MSSILLACRMRSRICASPSGVMEPLVSFIAAQMPPIALWVPEVPMASSQPSRR